MSIAYRRATIGKRSPMLTKAIPNRKEAYLRRPTKICMILPRKGRLLLLIERVLSQGGRRIMCNLHTCPLSPNQSLGICRCSKPRRKVLYVTTRAVQDTTTRADLATHSATISQGAMQGNRKSLWSITRPNTHQRSRSTRMSCCTSPSSTSTAKEPARS
jgi:hypothetical protein